MSIRTWKISIVMSIVVVMGSIAQARNIALQDSDLISDWMDIAAANRMGWYDYTPQNLRAEAVVALAMFEAANAQGHQYPSFLGGKKFRRPYDKELAISAAAAHALMLLYPEKQAHFMAALDARMPAEARRSRVTKRALLVGEDMAQAAFLRGSALVDTFPAPHRRMAPVGAYVPTGLATAIRNYDLALRPWVLSSKDAARPAAPPALTSKVYADDLAEVRMLGARTGSNRQAADTEAASFWFLIDLNPLLREIAADPGRDHAQNARMYAMFYMAKNDAWITSAAAKTHFMFWRPITAIRQSGRDNNPDTIADVGWLPLLPTPAHPEYPCAHCVMAAAQAVVLAHEINDQERRFAVSSSTLMAAPARDATLANYVEETSFSRLYAGAHYRFSNAAGEASGVIVGQQVLAAWQVNTP